MRRVSVDRRPAENRAAIFAILVAECDQAACRERKLFKRMFFFV